MKNNILLLNFKYLILLLGILIFYGCGEGSFSIGTNKGVITSWPGQNWIFFFVFLIIISLVSFAIRGSMIINDFEDLVNNSKELLPASIKELRNTIKDIERYSEENKKLHKEINEKQNSLLRLEGRIEEMDRQTLFNKDKYMQDLELVRLQTINEYKKKEAALREKIARLEGDLIRYQLQSNLFSYYLAKYKINIYSDNGDDFIIQKRIWIDRVSQGDLDLVIDHLSNHSRVAEEYKNEILSLQTRLSMLNKERNLGMIGYNDENTKNDINRIVFTLLDIIKKLPN